MSTSHVVIRPRRDGEDLAVSIEIDGRQVANHILAEGFSIVPAERDGNFRVTMAFEGTLEFEDEAAEVAAK